MDSTGPWVLLMSPNGNTKLGKDEEMLHPVWEKAGWMFVETWLDGHPTPEQLANALIKARDLAKEPVKPGGTDPRIPGGGIAGPGGPHDRNAVVIDATDAVLMDNVHVALIEPYKDGERIATKPWWVLHLGGRINKTQERAEIAYLFDVDGAAGIVTELIALASRQGQEVRDDLMERVEARLDDLIKDGNL